MSIGMAEYIWMDGNVPTQQLRSKARIINSAGKDTIELKDFPEWSFDGSSTNQSEGGSSDLILKPVNFCSDPVRGPGNFLVMCEVFNEKGEPHVTNTRAQLRKVLDAGGAAHEPWAGFEQEYTLFSGRVPLGWPDKGYPAPQGPFYCGVGQDQVFGRELIEEHLEACLEAGLMFYGMNAEVMPGQWEFQIGYRGVEQDNPDILNCADHLWLARWLLYRIAEDYGITVTLDNKPVKGDWNGAGCHTNFSTKAMRDAKTGMKTIERAIEALRKRHDQHVVVYGDGLELRLTGLHETCRIDEFRSGVADRGASVRIPQQVQLTGHGYLEDRRPGANIDPYIVSARLVTTICELDESLFTHKPAYKQMSLLVEHKS